MPPQLTNSTAEVPLSDILNGKTQIEVPVFQRPYEWKKGPIIGLLKDIEELALQLDDDEAAHFMGAIIVHQEDKGSSYARRYFIIDGQQRLISLFLVLNGLALTYAKNNHLQQAEELVEDYLLLERRRVEERSNLAILPGLSDRANMTTLINSVLAKGNLGDKLGDRGKFIPFDQSESDQKNLLTVFKHVCKWCDEMWSEGGFERFESIREAVLSKLTFVEIFVKDPLSGPQIYDRLNARGTPLTIADLVKNSFFSRAGASYDELRDLDRAHWQPFYQKFSKPKQFENFFFPLGLLQDPNLKKAEVYRHLLENWSDLDPKKIVAELSDHADHYLAASQEGYAKEKVHQSRKSVADMLERLIRLGSPTAALPFLMRVSIEVNNGSISPKQAEEALRTVEVFLVRRAVSGMEPTGLHAVFKSLWGDITKGEKDFKKIAMAKEIRAVIGNNVTIEWPSDDLIREKVRTRRMYQAKITRFLLLERDAEAGESPQIEPEIDHIYPQTPNAGSWMDWTKTEDRDSQHCLGNLALLSKQKNVSATNKEWVLEKGQGKRELYKGNAFPSTAKIAEDYETWTPEDFKKRSDELANWILSRWE